MKMRTQTRLCIINTLIEHLHHNNVISFDNKKNSKQKDASEKM